MVTNVRMACEPAIVVIPLDRILPSRVVEPLVKRSRKYRCIESSIRELGLIEPLVVYRSGKGTANYMLLDGHIRLEVLKDLKQTGTKCLVATDDEAFTYNHKVNRLSTIQEHFMIRRAIKNGVSEDRIARTLNVDLARLRQKRDLLDGICPEAVELLRDKPMAAAGFRELRKVTPMRQIEIAELTSASRSFSVNYVKCLVAATPAEQLLEQEAPTDARGLSAEDVARMEHEMELLGRDFKLIEETHGKNTLNLVVVIAYLKRLLDNARIVRFLSQNHHELFLEFQKVVESKMMVDPVVDGT